MASKLETDAVEPQSGTTLTLGAAGDTVDLSTAAVTLPAVSVTAGNLASSLDLSGKTVTLPADAVDTAELADDAVTPAKMNDSAYLANRNRIINGDFNVWQRATSSTAGGYGYETADRWYFGGNSGAGKQTTRQSGTPQEGFQYHMKVDANGISASNWVGIEQAIETSTVVPLRSQTITVSVYARKGASAQADNSYKLRLAQSNSTDARSTLNFGTGLTDTAMSLTTSFVRYSATVTVASDAVGISCSIVLTAGSSTATADDYIEITGVQLEIGDTATPFEHKTYGQELAACQRYFQLPVNWQAYSDTTTATAFKIMHSFPVTMRASPTIGTTGTPNCVKMNVNAGGPTTISNVPTANSDGFNGGSFTIMATGAGSAAATNTPYVGKGGFTADAEL